MGIYQYLILLISLSAAFAYINQRWIKLPFVIGLFFLTTVLSIAVLILGQYVDMSIDSYVARLEEVKIDDIILNILLGFLLFAGALHTNWADIKRQIKAITIFSVAGVIISTIIIATLLFYAAIALSIPVNFLYCLLFGALISPTDPIAVLGILAKAKVPKKTEITIVGESLFNDGIGVVLFIALLEMVRSGSTHFDLTHFSWLFIQEAVGGILFGLLFGYILHLLLKSIDHYETEILLTLAFVMTGYYLFNYIHISGALAMVVMGLMVGNFRTGLAMSDKTQEYVNKFWELVDVILNSILFILIAFVILVIEFNWSYFFLGAISIVIVLLARLLIVYIPAVVMPRTVKISKKDVPIIWWGGLRGGLSLALVLSLPASQTKEIFLVITYMVVVFSILFQGLTISNVAKRFSEQ